MIEGFRHRGAKDVIEEGENVMREKCAKHGIDTPGTAYVDQDLCPECAKEQLLKGYVETCPRCGAFMLGMPGLSREGSALGVDIDVCSACCVHDTTPALVPPRKILATWPQFLRDAQRRAQGR
jgi:hypothetical protein